MGRGRAAVALNPDETQQLIIDESAAARQLRAGFPWLRFEHDLEREFRRDQSRSRLAQIRFNLYLAAALVVCFGLLNAFVIRSNAQAPATAGAEWLVPEETVKNCWPPGKKLSAATVPLPGRPQTPISLASMVRKHGRADPVPFGSGGGKL